MEIKKTEVYVGNEKSSKPMIGSTQYNRLYVGDIMIYQYIEDSEDDDSSYVNVDLNNVWQASTVDIPKPDGVVGTIYETSSPDERIAKMKITFSGKPNFLLWYYSESEMRGMDYLLISKLDKELGEWDDSYSQNVGYNNRDKLSTWLEADFPNDGEEHFVEVMYRNDSRYPYGVNRGLILIPPKIVAERWILIDGYLCDGNDKYQKMVKEIKYQGYDEWYATLEYKKGNLIEANSTDCDWKQLTKETPKGTPIKSIRFDENLGNNSSSNLWIHLGETPTSVASDNTWAISGYNGTTWSKGRMVLDGRETGIEQVGTYEGDGVWTYTFDKTLYLLNIQPNAGVEAIQYRS